MMPTLPRPRLPRRFMASAVMMTLAMALLISNAARAIEKDVQQFTLDNGLQVVVIPDHRAPVVTQIVWYRVGSADEPPGKSGLAHLLEHLMFKGTPSVPPGEFSRTIARNGGQDNAFTSSDYTGYITRVARDRLELVMKLEADRMTNLQLTEPLIAPERGVILEERRSRIDNNPSSRLSEQLDAAFYLAHPYGKPVIGWASEIKALSKTDITDFYKRHYAPNNAVLIVAGDVTAEQLKPLAKEHFGPIARRNDIGPRQRPAEPEPEAERRVIMHDARVRTAQVRRAYLTPAYSTAEPREAEALDVLAELLGGDTTSRLYRQLVVDQKIAASAGAWYSGDNLDNGKLGVYALGNGTAPITKIENALDEILKRIVREGPTAEEVERAKCSLISTAIYARDSQQQLARIFGSALMSGQSVEDVVAWPGRIEAVTREDVHKVAKMYLRRVRSATGILLPDEEIDATRAPASSEENRT